MAELHQKKEVRKTITIEELKNIEDSWDILRPMYWTVDIYGTYEEYLKSAESFTIEQRYLLAVNWYFIEVNNGGHHQFLSNSTGIVWEDAINGFKLFGMNEHAANFQKMIDYFGGKIPFDREERNDFIDQIEEEDEEAFENIINECDDFVFDYMGEENEIDYIKNNPEKFVFDGVYYEPR